MQAGQTALIRVKAATADGKVPRDGYAVAEFWAPGRDPEHDAEAREHPDHQAELSWAEELRAWAVQVDTAGWEPGTWTVRGRASVSSSLGPARGWAWGKLPLAA